ncbi:MAG: hypothetical protein DLM63_07370 [Solirubrobacterales bacterium]|nr:MAG: hypothetical protein DLM63_07370 [Solirubrobacterales bacterium]
MSVAELFHDRYELERRLGVGGMSTVQLGFDTRLERHVAVKLLAEHLAEDPAFVARFQREAVAAGRLVHPNVVQVYDSGVDPATGQYFIVMEYVPGQSCAQLLRDQGSLDVEETLDIVGQACAGLDYAHRHGVVHRDVKPGNLLRSDEGTVKLADFGIARATDQSSITQIGSVLGTAAYLAPEQARGEEAGLEADLYSLGVVSYQMLAGRLPYEANSLTELALRQQQGPPPPLDAINPDVPPPLAIAVTRALAAEPAARYASAIAMRAAMRAAAQGIEPPALAYDPYPADGDATEAIGAATSATQALGGGPALEDHRTGSAPPRRRIEPRPPEPHVQRQQRMPARDPRVERKAARQVQRSAARRRRVRRLATALVLLALLGAGGVLAYDAIAPSAGSLRQLVFNDVSQGVQQIKQFIHDNTQ